MRSIALAIAAVLLLASCSDDPEPIEPTATRGPSDTPPTLPASAREDTPGGAANFVKYWIEVSNYAAQTGDTSELKEISDTDCAGCEKYIDLYESIYSNGGSIKGATRRLGEVDMEITGREVLVRGDVRAEEGRYRDSKDESERVSKANVTPVEFAVTFEKKWTMKQIGLPE